MLRHARVLSFFVVALIAVAPADAQTGPKRGVHVIVGGLSNDFNIGPSVDYNINHNRALAPSSNP
jgi:hypothetical protein